MRRLTLLIVLALASRSDLLGAQGPPPDDGLSGHYRGFAQSALNAELRMPMALLVDRSDGPEFFGSLTLGPIPFAFQGKIDAAGHFKGRGTGAAGDVSFIGTAQGFGDGGVLARATYKFAPASGARADQGVADVIRSPHLPPDPVIPLGGVYQGSVAYGTGMGDGKVSIEGIQDGTSLTGRIVLDPGTAKALSWEIVGGIRRACWVGQRDALIASC